MKAASYAVLVLTMVATVAAFVIPARAQEKPATPDPVSVIGVVDCTHYIGTVLVMPDGSLVPLSADQLPSEVAVRIAKALGHGHNLLINTCAAKTGTDT